ncbi:MAG TPA: response regulator [Pseudoduganella sp.]
MPAVAIIDDDESVRSAISSLLRSVGLNVSLFGSAEEFLAPDGPRDFDCVISDVQMSGMSGIELLETLRSRQCSTPFIVITAFPQEHLRKRASQAGASGFLTKPFDSAALLRCVENAVKELP